MPCRNCGTQPSLEYDFVLLVGPQHWIMSLKQHQLIQQWLHLHINHHQPRQHHMALLHHHLSIYQTHMLAITCRPLTICPVSRLRMAITECPHHKYRMPINNIHPFQTITRHSRIQCTQQSHHGRVQQDGLLV